MLIAAKKNPNVTVPITKFKGRSGGKVCRLFCLTWTVNGERKRRYHKELEDAKTDAQAVADSLASPAPDLADLKPQTRVDIAAAVQALRKAKIEKPLSAIVSDWIEVIKALNGLGTPLEAAKEFAERNAGLRKITVPNAVTEWIDQEESNKAGRIRSEWATKLRKNVEKRFAKDFTGLVCNLEPLSIDKWFSGLKNVQPGPHKGEALSETTKRNIRDDVASFFRWCQSHKYLPKDTDLLEAVPEYQRRSQKPKEIISPDDLQKMFNSASERLKPYLAVRALAGLRESEANLLDWKDVHLETGWIEITDEVAKQTADQEGVARELPIQPALKEWLASYAEKDGPLCALEDPLQAIPRLARKVGVNLPKNALRHSFITYRCAILGDVPRVADECGNSPAIIRKYYRKRGAQVQADAPKWFEIYPPATEAKIIPHPAMAGKR